ncbi:hypothetical protein CF15_04190 [Pyrodictium occultum]|uniref:Uncharacterized protein n=1 Tax=Pyrodictium occultum TaxID=2309 RepID=A0A0V8RVA5_PYROC|nr:hypothetical protein [Pyrodictium occultum]KSW11995.1 hypothetical protein CF15_04190 [Pyrodictium occultum]
MAIDFQPMSGKASSRAARYDTVLVVAPLLDALPRIEAYKMLGVERVEAYPLSPSDSPTLFSLLGVVAWLRRHASRGRVLVEGYGGEALLEAAYMIVEGELGLSSLSRVASRLLSSLHLRSLVHLAALAEAGVDLAREAERHLEDAFTGGDAYASSALEHSLDLAAQLGLLGGCILHLYEHVARGRRLQPSSICGLLAEAGRRLDYMKTGAVKTVAIVGGRQGSRVLLGCRLLLRDEECWPEAREAEEVIRRVLAARGYSLSRVLLVDPEEAACIAYGSRYGYPCG